MNHFGKKVLLKPLCGLTMVIVVLFGITLIPRTASALAYGPFTAYGGKIMASYSVLGIGPGVFRINNKETNSTVRVVSAGTTVGICISGGWILGLGIQSGQFIFNVIAGCLPYTPR